MGFGTKTAKAKPEYTGIQLQTASSVLPVPLVGGMTRVAPNLLDYTDFKAIKQKQKAGKGFGGSTTTYTYSATVIMGLCEGEISGVARGWKDDGEESDYSNFGLTLFTGPTPQTPWGYMTTAHPSQALPYPGTAYLAKANLDLGGAAQIGNYSFEVQGLFYNTQSGGAGDADPALWVDGLLTNAQWGAGYPADLLDSEQLMSTADATTTGDGCYQTWCRAMGFGISPQLTDQEAASDIIARWAQLTHTAPVWTGYSLKLIPYGDAEVSGNGVTYLPDSTIRYNLTDDDYVQDGENDPVRESVSDPADVKNIQKLEILDRANAYNAVPVPWKDPVSIATIGRREASLIKGHEICELDMAGKIVELIGLKAVNIRGGYEFTLDPKFCLLEAMDKVTLTDTVLGLDQYPVQIEYGDENDDDTWTFFAYEYPGSVNQSDGFTTSGATPTTPNALANPGDINPPIIFEPPASLLAAQGTTTPQIWAAVSGGDGTDFNPDWGGCTVWVSSDGSTYVSIGEISAPARMGVTTATLASDAGPNPDTTHTLSVDLSMSGGELTGGSSADAQADVTLSYVGGEYISFTDVTLTGPYAYDLDGELWRGLYGGTADAHSSGADFARLDEAIFKYDLPPAYVGITLYFKFTSFNLRGQAEQDLADVTAYTYDPDGSGIVGTPTGPIAGITASEDLAAGDLVNLWSDSGVSKMRAADATDGTRPAHGFVKAAVASGDSGYFYGPATIDDAMTGLTPGSTYYLSTTAGQAITSPPSADGNMVQEIGQALSATELLFNPKGYTLL